MMQFSLALRLVTAVAAGVVCVVACSSGTNVGLGPSTDAGSDGSSGSSGTNGTSGTSGTSAPKPDAATSCFDPGCPIALCQCKDRTYYSPSGICRKAGKCDILGACEEACGAVGFGGGVFERDVCTDALQCSTAVSQPSISCACNQGFGSETYPTCKDGRCSPAPEHTCPKACASYGGWTCKGSADCAPIVCACKDGRNPIAGSPCVGSSCSTPTAVCPSTCENHGGWSTIPNTSDAGPVGPKSPGEACSEADECGAFDCTCGNGNTFRNGTMCLNHVCPTKAQKCDLTCMGSGGWSGT